MYKVKVNGAFRGHFKTVSEAMAYIEKHARPFRHSWEIIDRFQKVYAQG